MGTGKSENTGIEEKGIVSGRILLSMDKIMSVSFMKIGRKVNYDG